MLERGLAGIGHTCECAAEDEVLRLLERRGLVGLLDDELRAVNAASGDAVEPRRLERQRRPLSEDRGREAAPSRGNRAHIVGLLEGSSVGSSRR